MAKTKGWTRRSYDALFNFTDPIKRAQCREIMLTDGLTDVVAKLDAANNMGVWYRITREAAEAVGPGIVKSAAKQAEVELNAMAAVLGRKGGMAKSEAKVAASRANGKLGGRPPKKEDE